MTRHPAALPWKNVVKNSYLSKYLNYQVSLGNSTKQITVYMKYLGKSFVSEAILKDKMGKKLLSLSFKGGALR